ncbi:MAG: 30S ribosomal protein S8e [Candidatus Thermoplasmatota archaeon]|jgi:small subunit ribosomal protein S8e
MSLWQGLSTRKSTGGRLIRARKKLRFEVAPEDAETKLGEHSQKLIRARGASQKVKLLATDSINVTDAKTGKTSKATIKTVTENPANIHYVRRNILTKGAVVDTDKGKVKVTSRPGQSGSLSGILVQ